MRIVCWPIRLVRRHVHHHAIVGARHVHRPVRRIAGWLCIVVGLGGGAAAALPLLFAPHPPSITIMPEDFPKINYYPPEWGAEISPERPIRMETVPEPSTLALLLPVSIAILLWRKK